MFCSNCGEKVADGDRFCTECGTPVAGPAPQQTQRYAPPPQNTPEGPLGGKSTLLLEFHLMTGALDANFNYCDANGKKVSLDKLFNRNKGELFARALLSSPLSSLTDPGFNIKAEVYDNKIRFARKTKLGLGKPSDDWFVINGSEIASVGMNNTFFDKSVTIVTHSGEKLNFAVPKKEMERIVQILNDMKSN